MQCRIDRVTSRGVHTLADLFGFVARPRDGAGVHGRGSRAGATGKRACSTVKIVSHGRKRATGRGERGPLAYLTTSTGRGERATM